MKRLITFDYNKAGNIANLSRIDPSLLGVKDASSFTKNSLYLHGNFSVPLLCFSLILVTHDNHEHGRVFGSEPKWVIKDIAGVLPAMELERFIAVLGVAYELPYVPDDSARREGDLLHLSMIENAFSFSTAMMLKSGKLFIFIFIWEPSHPCPTIDFDKASASSSSKTTPKRVNKIYTPASPAFSSGPAVLSSAPRRPSLRPLEKGMADFRNKLFFLFGSSMFYSPCL